VIQARAAFIEGFPLIGPVRVQPDPDTQARVEQQHGVAGLFTLIVRKRDRHPIHPEQPLVPAS